MLFVWFVVMFVFGVVFFVMELCEFLYLIVEGVGL